MTPNVSSNYKDFQYINASSKQLLLDLNDPHASTIDNLSAINNYLKHLDISQLLQDDKKDNIIEHCTSICETSGNLVYNLKMN